MCIDGDKRGLGVKDVTLWVNWQALYINSSHNDRN